MHILELIQRIAHRGEGYAGVLYRCRCKAPALHFVKPSNLQIFACCPTCETEADTYLSLNLFAEGEIGMRLASVACLHALLKPTRPLIGEALWRWQVHTGRALESILPPTAVLPTCTGALLALWGLIDPIRHDDGEDFEAVKALQAMWTAYVALRLPSVQVCPTGGVAGFVPIPLDYPLESTGATFYALRLLEEIHGRRKFVQGANLWN